MAKRMRVPRTLAKRFTGVAARRISRDEIYHRLEWYFDAVHNPNGSHSIPPATPIEAFFQGIDPVTGRVVLYTSLNRSSSNYVPSWQSMLFHGVQIPWESPPDVPGMRDLKNFGQLINLYVLSYRHVGWTVT